MAGCDTKGRGPRWPWVLTALIACGVVVVGDDRLSSTPETILLVGLALVAVAGFVALWRLK